MCVCVCVYIYIYIYIYIYPEYCSDATSCTLICTALQLQHPILKVHTRSFLCMLSITLGVLTGNEPIILWHCVYRYISHRLAAASDIRFRNPKETLHIMQGETSLQTETLNLRGQVPIIFWYNSGSLSYHMATGCTVTERWQSALTLPVPCL
jgi:hypothetical protein